MSQKAEGSLRHPNGPASITLILLQLQQGGRDRRKGGGGEGNLTRTMLSECTARGVEGPGEERGKGTRGRENWKK